jgi:hypothetical protein
MELMAACEEARHDAEVIPPPIGSFCSPKMTFGLLL